MRTKPNALRGRVSVVNNAAAGQPPPVMQHRDAGSAVRLREADCFGGGQLRTVTLDSPAVEQQPPGLATRAYGEKAIPRPDGHGRVGYAEVVGGFGKGEDLGRVHTPRFIAGP